MITSYRLFMGLVLQLALFCPVLAWAQPGFAEPRKKLVFSVNDLPSYSKLMREIYRIINGNSKKYEIELMFMPLKRQQVEANEGLTDGLGLKAESPPESEEYNNLIKVPTPMFYANSIIAIHRDEADTQTDQQILTQKVAILNGAVHARKFVAQPLRVLVNSHQSGLLMVASKRVPAMLTLELAYYTTVLQSKEVADKTKLAAFHFKEPFYMFIHIKNPGLVAEMDAILKNEGVARALQGAYDAIIGEMKLAAKAGK